jgi:branched-chain amino acid transport system ATP-binding protein
LEEPLGKIRVEILRLENIFKDFSGLKVLSGIDLEISQGERHAIIGPNGAGKSTLFNIITGMYRPTSGRIFFCAKDITGWPAHKIARSGLSRSFQIVNIFPKMTVFENVRNAIISKLNHRFNWTTLLNREKQIRIESERIIELVGQTDRKNVLSSELSYGAQRQLELALTLAGDPVLIMLDEPTAGLNIEETRRAVELIRQITKGKTLIVVEHDMEVVFSLADRITVLNAGKILAIGAPSEIREKEEVRAAYLGRK